MKSMTLAEFFIENQPFTSASAPGQLDVMGGTAEYSGSLVLQLPLRERVHVMAALRKDDWVRVFSENLGEVFTMHLGPFRRFSQPLAAYRQAQETIFLQKNGYWAAAVVGSLLMLCFENSLFLRGIDFYVSAELPLTGDPSGAAALEVATLRALEKIYGISLTGTLLPRLAQATENHIVGKPGVLADRLTSHFGTPGRVLPVVCQPDRVFEPMNSLPELYFFKIEIADEPTEARRKTYAKARSAAFMGYSMLAETQGVPPKTLHGIRWGSGRAGLPWGGYLCNIERQIFQEKFAGLLPETMSGAAFLDRYGQTIDDLTSVVPDEFYDIRACTSHVVFENHRTRLFYQLHTAAVAGALEQNHIFRMQYLSQLGELMFESHESGAACGLSDEKSDLLVRLAREFGALGEVYGARATADGRSVCAMVYGETGVENVREIVRLLEH